MHKTFRRGLASLIIAFCASGGAAGAQAAGESMDTTMPSQDVATFAGGCFWCLEPPFEELEGVASVTAGYTGGRVPHPSYEQVCAGDTGHAEAVQVRYDPAKISYEQLLEVFWKNIDPTTRNQQFVDRGSQYRTAIFYHNEAQRQSAEDSKRRVEHLGKFKGPIVTEIAPAGEFYPAEEYHQDYYKKNALHYQLYKTGSGREGFLKKTWSDVPPGAICPLRRASPSSRNQP